MALYAISVDSNRVIEHGTDGQCYCGKIAETEIQVGWDPKANAGAGGGQYDQVCWDCRDESEQPIGELASHSDH
jgi:hypothetical protein